MTFCYKLNYTVIFYYLNLHFYVYFFLKVLFYVSGLVKYDPMRTSSYFPLLKELKTKWGCLSIENNDKKCFPWSILASKHLLQHKSSNHRVFKYHEYEHELNTSGTK